MHAGDRRGSGLRVWKLASRGCPGRVVVLTTVLLSMLGACASHPPAPIEGRAGSRVGGQDERQELTKGKPYTVERGDSLYGIAFRLGVDFKALASWNGISAPYSIYPGQVLKTSPSTSARSSSKTDSKSKTVSSTASRTSTASASTAAPKTKSYKVQRGDTLYSIATSLGIDFKSLAAWNGIVAPYTLHPGQVLSTSPGSAPAPLPRAKETPTQPKASAGTSSKAKPKQAATKSAETARRSSSSKPLGPVSRWLWPSGGSLERSYSSVLHKGVDIKGKRGDPVRATADGEVVYSGTGVKGYGALLIIKHNEQFLSAYGHNDAILVAEGERVRAGQQIARMGSTGTDSVKLHFEIRREGKPVDPLKLLPKR